MPWPEVLVLAMTTAARASSRLRSLWLFSAIRILNTSRDNQPALTLHKPARSQQHLGQVKEASKKINHSGYRIYKPLCITSLIRFRRGTLLLHQLESTIRSIFTSFFTDAKPQQPTQKCTQAQGFVPKCLGAGSGPDMISCRKASTWQLQ